MTPTSLTRSLCVLAVLCGLARVGAAASFDCKKAKTASEKLICADEELGRLDEALAKAYAEAARALGDGKALRKAQSLWLRSQRDTCKDSVCMRARMASRLAELRAMAKPLARTGTYADRRGEGSLEVLELSPDVLRFALEITVTTASGEPHLGQLCGEVTLSKGRGTYTSPGRTEAEPDCVIAFSVKKDALELHEDVHCSDFSDQVIASGRYARGSRGAPLLLLCQEYGVRK